MSRTVRRERRDEDRGDELDAADERLQRRRNAGRPQQVLEVAEPLVLQPGADEHDPDEQRQATAGSRCGRWPASAGRDDAGDVAEEDEDEQAEEERGPAEARLAEGLHDDALLDELDGGLGQVAGARRCLLRIGAAGEQEQHDADERSRTAISAILLNVGKMSLPTKDFVDRRELESRTRCFRFSRGGSECDLGR